MRERFVSDARIPSKAPEWLATALADLYRDIAKRFRDAGSKNVPDAVGTTPNRSWVGECLETSSGFTINNSVFVKGDTFSVCNTSASSITITQGSGVTLRLAGTATTGNRTLAGYGLVTIRFLSASEAFVLGAGVT